MKSRKIVASLLALAMIAATPMITVKADPLQDQKQQLEAEKNNTNDKLQKAQDEYGKVSQQMSELESKIASLQNDMTVATNKKEETNKKIEQVQGEITVVQGKVDKVREAYAKRVQAMQMNGVNSYLTYVLESKGFGELLSRLNAVSSIMESDKKMATELKVCKDDLDNKKLALDQEKQQVVALQNEINTKLAEAETSKGQLQPLYDQAKNIKEKYAAEFAQIEAKQKDLVNQIIAKQLEEQKAREEQKRRDEQLAQANQANQANQGNNTSNAGGNTSNAGGNTSNAGGNTSNAGGNTSNAGGNTSNAGGSSSNSGSSSNDGIYNRGESASATGQAVLAGAAKFYGVPYVWGGTTPSGFDCSGLTQYVYRQLGINLPRTTDGQITVGRPVGRNELQVGDLVFFGYGGYPDHVGIYAGNDTIIHATRPGDTVRYSPIKYMHQFMGARRVIQ